MTMLTRTTALRLVRRLSRRVSRFAEHLRSERGDGVAEGLLMFGLIAFVVVVIVQAALWVHARSVADDVIDEQMTGGVREYRRNTRRLVAAGVGREHGPAGAYCLRRRVSR